jgi:hypothetical protein
MANNIILKKSSVADKVPLTTDLQYGEVALNYADGKLYYKDSSNNVKSFDSAPTHFYLGPTNNTSGVTIPAGAFVMVTGVQGDRVTIAKAVTNGTVDQIYMIGVAEADIIAGATDGKIMTNGVIYGLNTNGWVVGTVLYPDPTVAGGLTSTKPSAPNIRTAIAIVLRQSSNSGRILVRMETGSTLGGTDTNVNFANLTTDDVIKYDATTSTWVNTKTLNLTSVTATTMVTTTQAAGDVSTKVATTAFADNVALNKAVAMAIALG